MIDLGQEPWLTLLDKGLLAIILAALAWFLNRSVERLKSSLSWRNELLKEHLAQAKSLLLGLNAIEDAHRRLALLIGSGFPIDNDAFENFMNAKAVLWQSSRQARLLLSNEVIQLVLDVNDASTQLLPVLQKCLRGEVIPEQELSHRQFSLERSIKGAIARLEKEFRG